MISASLRAFLVWCLIAQTPILVSGFQSILPLSSTLQTTTRVVKLGLAPEIHNSMQQLVTPSLLLSADVESWRQYVPLVTAVAVIIDILLGSPLANLVLGPMKRASDQGSGGGDDEDEGGGGGSSGGSLFGGKFDSFAGSGSRGRGSSERVDSKAIAQATYDKAMGTLELRRFLDENKTDEQTYEEVRKKLDRQMEDLEDM